MCYELYHNCTYCNNQYECNLPNYICPTINHDEDMNMCDMCRIREANAFREAMENETLPASKPITIDDWENEQ